MDTKTRDDILAEIHKQYGLFKAQLPALMVDHAGEFVVFHDGRADAFFPDIRRAIDDGKARFGMGRFIAQKVEPQIPVPLTAAIGLWAPRA